ncbi:MAG TPA: molecular chaperone HtpG [Anaerolineae bacterium]|nr:molecular chaperone HtpG [Anaerolineae bacterium]
MISQSHETRTFQAEVKQVLDIVIHSLYINREIFIRELISNASDALEKMRYESLIQKINAEKTAPFEIRIDTDSKNHTISVTDTGVGMTHEELINNIGTIARSGTREFLENLAENKNLDSELIGKFGVGFYSSFMVAKKVRLRTRSFKNTETGYEWASDGIGEYTISEEKNIPLGTTVIVELKDDSHEFEKTETIKEIINKYSNFVPFPILLNGEKVNTVQAIWLKNPSEVSDSEYKEFFKFLSNSTDEPVYRIHLTSDAPLQFSSILYVPAENIEQFGLVKLKPSINLYCKKILVEQHTEKLVPDYLRFVTGVVDSADLTLNISRETLQDNLVFRKLGKFLTRRFLRFLDEEAAKDPKKYGEFWKKFGMFIKEGIVSDLDNRQELSKLLRFSSNHAGIEEYVSLTDYLGRMKENQTAIYYINGHSREDIERGPYIETFKSRDIEVLYLYTPIDDFVMSALGEFEGKKLISADSSHIELPPVEAKEKKKVPDLSSDELKNLTQWMKDTLGNRVTEVRETKRIMNRPAIIVNPEETITTTMHRVMKASGKDFGIEVSKILEINPHHPIITTLKRLRDGKADKGFLQTCVEQIYDNALTESGLLEDPQTMINRVYTIMERALKAEESVHDSH